MKIRFMGTGAADFSPLLTTEYKDQLDNNARRSSSILINEAYLVDCGPHVADSFRIQGLDPAKVTDLLVTHFHGDHYKPEVIAAVAAARKAAGLDEPLQIWHRGDARPDAIENCEFHPMEVGQTYEIGDLKVKALASNHDQWPAHYDIEADGKKLFYGCDGSWLLMATFYAMRQRKYDCMILDATVGDYSGDFRLGEHNSIPMIRLMEASFRTENVIAQDGKLVLSHLARTLHKPHEETAALLGKEGYIVAFDGMELLV